MQLNPRYGSDPVIVLDGVPADIVGPAIRQRRRLAAVLSSFTAEQWAHPSRCEGWSNRDVIVHLESTNAFWAFAIGAGVSGEATRFLATFDPVASPAQLVADSTSVSTEDLLERFVASTESLAAALQALGDEDWLALAEAPPGHISVSAVVHHALWDSWVHERDVLVPLGIAGVVDADEVAACLRYVAALGPALAINNGATEVGTMLVSVTSPQLEFSVAVDHCVAVSNGAAGEGLRITGDAVEVLEALSMRRPLDQQIPADSRWMFYGLAEVFDADRN